MPFCFSEDCRQGREGNLTISGAGRDPLLCMSHAALKSVWVFRRGIVKCLHDCTSLDIVLPLVWCHSNGFLQPSGHKHFFFPGRVSTKLPLRDPREEAACAQAMHSLGCLACRFPLWQWQREPQAPCSPPRSRTRVFFRSTQPAPSLPTNFTLPLPSVQTIKTCLKVLIKMNI